MNLECGDCERCSSDEETELVGALVLCMRCRRLLVLQILERELPQVREFARIRRA